MVVMRCHVRHCTENLYRLFFRWHKTKWTFSSLRSCCNQSQMIVIEFVMKARWHFFTSKCIFLIFFNKCILIYTEFHYNSVLLYTWNYLLKFCMSKLVRVWRQLLRSGSAIIWFCTSSRQSSWSLYSILMSIYLLRAQISIVFFSLFYTLPTFVIGVGILHIKFTFFL